MIVDYTTMQEGTAVSAGGVIHRCTACKRMGERRPNAAKSKPWMFVHRVEVTPRPSGGSKIKILEKCTAASAGSAPVHQPMTQGFLV